MVVLQPGEASAESLQWTTSISPNASSTNNTLNSLSCISPTDCVAVGDYNFENNIGATETLIESWDGSSWTIVASPPGGQDGYLNGVSCTSPTNCVAVGYDNTDTGAQTLIETWDGSTWSVEPSPTPSNGGVSLTGVSCTSSMNCVAAGYYTYDGPWQTLIESWNGSTWSIVPSPNQGSDYNFLYGVSCTSPTYCVAVGDDALPDGTSYQTLIESWDGIAWSVASSPSPNEVFDDLNDVSCTSPTNCIAVGSSLIESWDGSAWTVEPGGGDYNLESVVCISQADCTAVGGDVIDSWNGSAWAVTGIVTARENGGGSSLLYGVSCSNQADCEAVGYGIDEPSGVDQTLIGHGIPTPPPVIRKINPKSGYVGTKVTITGTNLINAFGPTGVNFDGVSAVVSKDTSTKIITSVPPGATNGYVQVTGPGGTATSSEPFTVATTPPPTITKFTPRSGLVGRKVVVKGTSLFGAISVTFNGIDAPISVDTSTQITTHVPAGATTGPVQVTTGAGTATSTSSFTVT
jgi:hypothetical protein